MVKTQTKGRKQASDAAREHVGGRHIAIDKTSNSKSFIETLENPLNKYNRHLVKVLYMGVFTILVIRRIRVQTKAVILALALAFTLSCSDWNSGSTDKKHPLRLFIQGA